MLMTLPGKRDVYKRQMLEKYPQLLAQNVNAWFQREPSVLSLIHI